MIRVKLSTSYPHWPLLRQTPGSRGQWGKCQFFFGESTDDQHYDFWAVCDNLAERETAFCAPQNTLLVTGEPPSIRTYSRAFTRQFATVVTCQREIKHPRVVYWQQALPWHVNKSYDELLAATPVAKTKLLSIVTSNKQWTAGHRQRYAFALELQKHFGQAVELFGRGSREFEDKWDVLAPYRYSVTMENCSHPDYFTEKLADCLLAEALPFYYGCPNLQRYFTTQAIVPIDINDLEGSIRIIENVLNDATYYERHHTALLEAKTRYLAEHNIFPLLARLIEERHQPQARTKRLMLRPDPAPHERAGYKIQRGIARVQRMFHSSGEDARD